MVEDNPDFDPMEKIEAELHWETDEAGDELAHGIVFDYEIDPHADLAIFRGERCIRIYECADVAHGEAMAEAVEREMIRNRKRGCTWHGKPAA